MIANDFTLAELRTMRTELRLLIEERTKARAGQYRDPVPQAITWKRPPVSGLQITDIDGHGTMTRSMT
jgi:hypothetical protein